MPKWLFLFLLLSTTSLHADEITEEEIDLLAPEPEIVEDIQASPTLPSCQDENVQQHVTQLLEEYNKEHPVHSIYEKRQRTLQIRLANHFEEQPVTGFTSRQNRSVADKLLITKINNGLNDSEIRLCKSNAKGTEFKPVYLMIYNHHQKTELHILNFLDNPAEELKTDL